jgi:hypothetical protein
MIMIFICELAMVNFVIINLTAHFVSSISSPWDEVLGWVVAPDVSIRVRPTHDTRPGGFL